jgi:hypothetical protein
MKGKPNQQAKRRERREAKAAAQPQTKAAPAVASTPAPTEPACQPIAPRPKLFRLLMVGFVVWVGVLLGLYLKTVYPMRHAGTSPATMPR